MSDFITTEFRDFDKIFVCLSEVGASPDRAMMHVAENIAETINTALSEKCERVEVKWVNIYDRDTNPDLKIGHFAIRGFRKNPPDAFVSPSFIRGDEPLPICTGPIRKMEDGALVRPTASKGAFGPIAPEDQAAFAAQQEDAAGECLKRVEAEQAKD